MILKTIGRDHVLFGQDLLRHEKMLTGIVGGASFLVIGGAGSIGQAVVKEIFRRRPVKLHVVDISENNLVELVRDIRSSFGYMPGDFRTFALDVGSVAYDAFAGSDGRYDYVLNFSALKHVRSEKDPFTLMRMIDVNILNTEKTVEQAIRGGALKYFCVSTDKAAGPVSMMGASKRIMEMFLVRRSGQISISTARVANVAFSDGSLLHGFERRMRKRQPLVAPTDVKRYFVTAEEAGVLCLMSCLLGENLDVFFPRPGEHLRLVSLADVAVAYLRERGFEPHLCQDEDEARALVASLPDKGRWPCLFTVSDTTGEKEEEEFFCAGEIPDYSRFEEIGVIKNDSEASNEMLDDFLKGINEMKNRRAWTKAEILALFHEMIPGFRHLETGKYLDAKM